MREVYKMKILILGAGFGGLEIATTLSEALGSQVDVTLIDKSDSFVFGFSKLDVMFGKEIASAVRHPYSQINKPGLKFIKANIRSIDPVTRSVETDAGRFEADIMVVALGADYNPSATPGLAEAGYEFYSFEGAFALRETLQEFQGGNVVVGVASAPYKCPPAPSEAALLMHDLLTSRGLRDKSTISLVIPFGIPIPPSPGASEKLVSTFKERGIDWYPDMSVTRLDEDRRVAVLSDGSELPFDLFLGIPVHVAPAVVLESGLCVDGWIPVDSFTLETTYPNVYAVGDVTSVGTAKAGVFSEGQGKIVAKRIIDRIRSQSENVQYDGRGLCYIEFGKGVVGQVDVVFLKGERPHGEFEGPTHEIADDKVEFGSSRVRRWFGNP
jgi:sulfide:quinone oxidoreductase